MVCVGRTTTLTCSGEQTPTTSSTALGLYILRRGGGHRGNGGSGGGGGRRRLLLLFLPFCSPVSVFGLPIAVAFGSVVGASGDSTRQEHDALSGGGRALEQIEREIGGEETRERAEPRQ